MRPGARASRFASVGRGRAGSMCSDVAVMAAVNGTVASHLVFSPELDALASCVKDQLGVDTDPRVAGPERRPVADELQRPAWWQRPGPPPGVLIVRGATATAWPQERPGRLGVTVRSAAGDRAPSGELQADRVGLVGEYAAV